jgi:hypothetical protein
MVLYIRHYALALDLLGEVLSPCFLLSTVSSWPQLNTQPLILLTPPSGQRGGMVPAQSGGEAMERKRCDRNNVIVQFLHNESAYRRVEVARLPSRRYISIMREMYEPHSAALRLVSTCTAV